MKTIGNDLLKTVVREKTINIRTLKYTRAVKTNLTGIIDFVDKLD